MTGFRAWGQIAFEIAFIIDDAYDCARKFGRALELSLGHTMISNIVYDVCFSCEASEAG